MKTSIPSLFLSLTLACSFLSACGGDKTTDTPLSNNASSSCSPEYEENLLKDIGFNQIETEFSNWRIAQHIGERAFELTIRDSVATITKISEQPWYTLSQNIDVSQLLNKTLEFSADFKLNLTESKAHAFKAGGGFQVLVHGKPVDPLSSEQLVYESTLENKPKLGISDWGKSSITFEIPDNATQMMVGFLHQADGEMSIRKPSLRVVSKTCP